MTWTSWMVLMAAWPIVGMGVAYLFGRLIRGVEAPEDVNGLFPPVVSYVRRSKRKNSFHSNAATNRAQRKAESRR